MAGNTEAYLSRFEAERAALPGAGLAWLDGMRQAAIARFDQEGFPSSRSEGWKYTDLRRLARLEFGVAGASDGVTPQRLAPWLAADAPCHRLVFVDGRYAGGLSDIGRLPDGVTLTTLADAIAAEPETVRAALAEFSDDEGDQALAALNTALMQDGVVLRLAPGAVLDDPVHVVCFASGGAAPTAIHPRNLVIAGDNSRATLIETFAGDDGAAGWTNAVCEISLGAGASFSHVRLQQESAAAYHISLTRVRLARDAAYSGFALSVGAALARNEIRATLTGTGADCRLAGGALVRGRQHADITTEIDHEAPHGISRQVFRNVLDDRGRAVFQGRVVVRPDAQKVDAGQSNRNLLLSPGAQVSAKPELRIFADDVKCSHGATVGELDGDALFYLRSRGIAEDAARALLVRGFVGELVDHIAAPAGRELAERAIAGWLGVAGDEA